MRNLEMLSKEIAPLGPVTLLQIFLVLLATSAEIFGSPCFADGINPLFFPGARYTKENPNSEALAHWDAGITMQFIGLADNGVRQTALEAFLPLASAAQVSLRVSGFPDDMFPESAPVSPEANFLVIEYDRDAQSQLQNGGQQGPIASLDLSGALPQIRKILNNGLKAQFEGCLAQWSATSDNVINGYVLAVGRWLASKDKERCIEIMSPTAFGVRPIVSTYDLRKFDLSLGSGPPLIYSDSSEVVLELQAAAACRNFLMSFGVQCPANLILSIFHHHEELLNAVGKK